MCYVKSYHCVTHILSSIQVFGNPNKTHFEKETFEVNLRTKMIFFAYVLGSWDRLKFKAISKNVEFGYNFIFISKKNCFSSFSVTFY